MTVSSGTFQTSFSTDQPGLLRFGKMQQQHQVLRSGACGSSIVVPPKGLLRHRLVQSRARIVRRALPGFGTSSDGGRTSSSKDWQVPETLLPTGKPVDQAGTSGRSSPSSSTVYTLRLSTSWDRGSAMSEPMAGIHVCLIGKSGSAVLHRIPPVNDPMDRLNMMRDICSSVGDEVGADCSILGSVDDPSMPSQKATVIKQRFQEGSVDEVSFVAPELGSLAAIMVAPEGGSWVCDEVDVYSSRSNHTDRFVCRQRLGGRKGEPAAYLTPVPPNAVVYGTGDAARIISKEQAAALKSMGMSDYESLKARLLLTTALLTAGGSGVAAVTAGPDAAVPFAIGGLAGLMYQLLLQLGADAAVAQAATANPGSFQEGTANPSSITSSSAGVSAAVTSFSAAAARSRGTRVPAGTMAPKFLAKSASQESFQGRALRVVGSTPFRLLLLSTAALAGIWLVQSGDTDRPAGGMLTVRAVDAWQLGLGLCGFMMFKVAVLGVSLTTPDSAELPERALEKKVQ